MNKAQEEERGVRVSDAFVAGFWGVLGAFCAFLFLGFLAAIVWRVFPFK